ncbi:MAG: lipopolysaccharide biosynthesis protein [Hyphomicrobiaceae bacterium]|nr:lipopolysaccharide biosynthesis protein [Hyphomicrobiaceae bacterium]
MPSSADIVEPVTGDKPSPVHGVVARVRDILTGTSDRSQAQRDALLAFSVRVVSAGLLYVSQIVLARWMGAFEYGIYVFIWTMVLVLGGISHLGLNMAMMRLLPAYQETGRFDLMRGLLNGGRWLSMYVGFFVALVGYGILRSTSIGAGSPYLEPALAILICVPIFALTDLQDGLGRGRGWMAVALFPPYVLRPLVLLVTMGFAHLAGLPMDAITAALAAIVACWAAAIVQTLLVQVRLDREVPAGPREYDFGAWLKVSLPLLAMYASEIVLQNADVLVLSAYLSPAEVGMYFAAAKTMALVMFIHYAVGSAAAKRYSALSARGATDELKTFVGDAVRWTFWPSLLVALLILALGKPLLWLFSPTFVDAYPLMFVLAIGYLFRAAMGPAEFLLNMVGEQRLCAMVLACSAVLNIGLNLLLVPRIGIWGAAIATSVSVATAATLNGVIARRRLGLELSIFANLRG